MWKSKRATLIRCTGAILLSTCAVGLLVTSLSGRGIDFNGDGADDLAVGVPGQTLSGETAAGSVHVVYGSHAAGLTTGGDQVWSKSVAGIAGNPHRLDLFGGGLAAGDFNGDGKGDLVVGIPGQDVDTHSGVVTDAGAVQVIYGKSSGLGPQGSQSWDQDSAGIADKPDEGDSLGAVLAVGDFNGDGRDDLALGLPNESVHTGPGTNVAAGAVQILYGSASGLSAAGNQIWTLATAGIPHDAEDADQFGASLAAGDFNGDGRDDLAIGIPGKSTAGLTASGAVETLYGSSSGLHAPGNQYWTQDSPGILDEAEAGDRFGSALAAGDFDGDGKDDLAIGVPHENVDGVASAGAVNVLYGTGAGLRKNGNQFWSQATQGVSDGLDANDQFGGALCAGDFDGDHRDDLAIGIALEDVKGVIDSGAVEVLYGGAAHGLTAAGDQFWSQSTTGIADVSEAGDNFGASLSSGDFDNDGRDDLAIGIPGEDIGLVQDAGAVEVLYGRSAAHGLTAQGDQFLHEDTPGMLGVAEAGDSFGSSQIGGVSNPYYTGARAFGDPKPWAPATALVLACALMGAWIVPTQKR